METYKIDGREKPTFTRGFHASGHASESELEWMIDKIDPDIIIPVYTENLEWFKERYENKAGRKTNYKLIFKVLRLVKDNMKILLN